MSGGLRPWTAAGLLLPLLACGTGWLAADERPKLPASESTSGVRISVSNPVTQFVDVITFSTERAGTLAFVPREGARIRPTDLVIRLKDEVPAAVLKVATARAEATGEIEVAEKGAASAWLEYESAVKAAKLVPDAYPETHINRLKLNAEGADARVRQARELKLEHQLSREQAAAELETYRVQSHIGGLVTFLHRRQGEGVQQGEPIVEVVNTDVIRVSGSVDLADSFRLQPGMPVEVRAVINIPGREPLVFTQTGELGFVDVKAAAFEDVRVWAEIPNPEGRLKEGMQVSMEILVRD